MLAYIDEHMPVKHRENYLRFIHNGKLSIYARKIINGEIKRLAEDYLNLPDTD